VELTLPVGSKGNPTEVNRPRAGVSAGDQWFGETRGHTMAFGAPVDGVTTSGSHYPRSELREMSTDGASPAEPGHPPPANTHCGWSRRSPTYR
jgi:hypothetical protein